MQARDILLPSCLFIFAVVTRLPFTSQLLFHMDSVHYALAMDRYDLRVHQPHPPGYFVYVMLGRLIRSFVDSPNAALVALSIVATAGCVVIVYLLAREMFGTRCGVLAGVIALTSPNLWFHGEIAMNYGVESLFSAAVGYASWKVLKGNHAVALFSLAGVLALAGGVRQNTPVFLLPLVIYACLHVPARKVVAAGVIFIAACLGWFLPMVHATGGWSAYYEAFHELWLFNTGHNTVFDHGLKIFLLYGSTLFKFVVCGLGAGVVLLALASYVLIRQRMAASVEKEQISFFTLWIAPASLFYLLIFIHPANPGYALIVTPPLFVLVARAVILLHEELSRLIRCQWDYLMAVVLVGVNLYLFLFSTYPISAHFIRQHDQNLSLMIHRLKQFDPATTTLFAGPYVFYGFRQVMYYLPEYRTYQPEHTVAKTGQVRHIMWGKDRQTFRADRIEFPEHIARFATPVNGKVKDHEFNADTIAMDQLLPEWYIASGDIGQIKRLYPELPLAARQAKL